MVLDWFRRTFRRSQEEVPESLVAFLQPTAHMARGVRPCDAIDFYAPFFAALKDAAESVYVNPFKEENTSVSRELRYQLTLDGVVQISYQAAPTIRQIPDSEETPSIYGGTLTIQQPSINLPRAGKLFGRMSDQARLAYVAERDPHFGIFYTRGEKTLDEGLPLLTSMGAVPEKACAYFVIPGVVMWREVDLTPARV